MRTGTPINGLSQPHIAALEGRIEDNGALIQAVVDAMVERYCNDLDQYVRQCQTIIQDNEHPPTTEELDSMTLTLPVLMYFTSEAQENLGIKEDVAEVVKQEAFNLAYEMTEGTVKDRTAAGTLASANENLVSIAYARAYKKIKQRLEYAMELLQSVKKVMSRRMVELEVTRLDSGRNKHV